MLPCSSRRNPWWVRRLPSWSKPTRHSPSEITWSMSKESRAMLYVVVEELIPEAHLGEHSNVGTLGVMAGFLVMMVLDTALG